MGGWGRGSLSTSSTSSSSSFHPKVESATPQTKAKQLSELDFSTLDLYPIELGGMLPVSGEVYGVLISHSAMTLRFP